MPSMFELCPGRMIGGDRPCFVIAEIGQNHQGDIEIAKKMIKMAKDCGADCAKFQKSELQYKFNKRALERPYKTKNSWGETYGEHKRHLEFSHEQYRELQKYAKEVGIFLTASGMDEMAIEFLHEINVPFFKVASADANNFPYLEKAAKKGRPMVISSGMQSIETMRQVYKTVKEHNENFVILQCTSTYPLKDLDVNLRVITEYQKEFPDIPIGYSGHESGISISVAAVTLGAKVIERHVTLDKTWRGSDHAASLEPSELAELVRSIRLVENALGCGLKRRLPCEESFHRKLGKSVVAKVTIPKGTVLSLEMLAVKVAEPIGVDAVDIFRLVGKTMTEDVGEDEAMADTDDHQPENGFVSPESTSSSSPGPLTRIDCAVLPFLGGFGKYQKQLILLTWIPALFIGFSQHSDNFLLAQPNNTCIQPLANTTASTTATTTAGGNVTWARSWTSGGPQNASGLAAGVHNDTGDDTQCLCNAWTFELHTGLVQNVVTKWSLVCNSAWKVHIAKFSLLVGSIFGYLVFGILADWFGRHPVLIISVLFMLVFGLTVAFSVNVPMFSTLRFFEGFCLSGITLSLYVLRIELCLPGWRFSMTMVASFVMLGGQLLMPGVAYLCRDWQVLQAVIICPLLLMLSYIWIFPESLRWLLATQQYCRSKWIMGHIAKKNCVNMQQDPDNILAELQRALQRKPKKTCIVKMARTRNLWKNIVVLCVNSLTGYGIHHCFARSMMDPEAQETTMFHGFYADYYTMAGIAVASCLALCPAVGLMGRRGGLLMFMIITALASLLQLGLPNLLGKYSTHLNIDSSGTLKKNFSIAFSIIGMFSSHAVSNLSIFFCAEITPTVIRGGGLGLVLASAGFGMLTAPIMELHNQKGYFLHHIIFACCTLICIICILLLPETRYHPLPETLAEGESYTRQPLLPPRKPGEQRLLLAPSESARDYTRVHDTPMHEAAATAVSTMDSASSSAIDLTALAKPERPDDDDDDGGARAALAEDDIKHASEERLLSSTPVHPHPLLSDEDKPSEVVLASIEPLAHAVVLQMVDTLHPSPTQEALPDPASEDPPPESPEDLDADLPSKESGPPSPEYAEADPPLPAPSPSNSASFCSETDIHLGIEDESTSSSPPPDPPCGDDLSPPPSPTPDSVLPSSSSHTPPPRSPSASPPLSIPPITEPAAAAATSVTDHPLRESLDSDSDSNPSGASPPSLLVCTVSSPIDSGVLSISASTENNVLAGVASS